ncbi:MAG: hypothetical protein JWP35_2099 [Caulobacter sp.]|nr:hypothetical protein [Caulobacter sp.]
MGPRAEPAEQDLMETATLKSRLPLYRDAIDWDAFSRRHPAPDVWFETIFKWPAERVREFQDESFRRLMASAWSNGFYQRLWGAAGIEPGDIRGLDDIVKLPTFTSDDIKADQELHPPFGEIMGVALGPGPAMPLKMQTSGGTTGLPRPTLYSPIDWELNGLTIARELYVQGGRPGDVMQIPSTCSLANFAWSYYKAAHDYLGILPLTTGSGVVTPSRRQLEIAEAYGANIWAAFPEYLTQLARVYREEFGRDVRDLKTKFLSSYLGPDLDGSLRAHLEALWGCPVYDNYGTHETGGAAFEGPEKDGLYLMEDNCFFEMLDVDTGAPVGLGETGNMTITLLHRQTPPIIRFNLRDLGRIVSDKVSPLGSSFRRMDKFLGRSDAMVKLRGTNVYPMACLSAVRSDPRTTSEWLCVVDRFERGGALRDEMTVRVEIRADAGACEGLAEILEKRLHADLGVKVAVELVAQGGLDQDANLGREGKPKRLLDRREIIIRA